MTATAGLLLRLNNLGLHDVVKGMHTSETWGHSITLTEAGVETLITAAEQLAEVRKALVEMAERSQNIEERLTTLVENLGL